MPILEADAIFFPEIEEKVVSSHATLIVGVGIGAPVLLLLVMCMSCFGLCGESSGGGNEKALSSMSRRELENEVHRLRVRVKQLENCTVSV